MTRIAATDVDNWIAFERGMYNLTKEGLISRLKREEPPSPAMLRGRLFHKAMEVPLEWGIYQEVAGIDHEDGTQAVFHFADGIVPTPLLLGIEVEAWCSIEFPEEGITIRGRADAICGNRVFEWKSTESKITAWLCKRYQNSFQWRIYLEANEADVLTYGIFQVKKVKGKDDEFNVVDFKHLDMQRYHGMREDILYQAVKLRDFMDENGIVKE